MRSYDRMQRVASQLGAAGVKTITPMADRDITPTASEKRSAALRHIRQIRSIDTDAILVVNESKNGVESYIGPNSFAEIAVAFADGKSIFVLYGHPAQYAEELHAWGVRALDGDISLILNELYPRRSGRSVWHQVDSPERHIARRERRVSAAM